MSRAPPPLWNAPSPTRQRPDPPKPIGTARMGRSNAPLPACKPLPKLVQVRAERARPAELCSTRPPSPYVPCLLLDIVASPGSAVASDSYGTKVVAEQ